MGDTKRGAAALDELATGRAAASVTTIKIVAGGEDTRPRIFVEPGAINRAVDAALAVLVADAARTLSAQPQAGESSIPASTIESGAIFQRGGRLSRIVRHGGQRNGVARAPEAPVFDEPGTEYIVDRLTMLARFERYDARSKAPRPIDCPEKVARMILARREYPNLPDVAAIVESPIVTADGRLLQEPGFDARTGLLLDFDPQRFPRVPGKPTRAQALEALAELKALLAGFAFAEAVDCSAAIAMLLSAVVRPTLPSAPMFAITAPAAGSGKTLLARTVALARSGREPAVTTFDAGDTTEFAKRIVSLLFAGDSVVVLDNAEGDFGSADLCAVLTSPMFRARVLGASEMRSVPAAALWIATGNNVRPRGDLTRRVIDVRLDTRLERPGDRVYEFDPIERVAARRGEIVSACLTIMLAAASHASRGQFDPPAPLPSFEVWSRLVRVPLVWLGMADPCSKMRAAEDLDPDRQQVRALFSAWARHIGDEALTLADLIRHAQADRPLLDALLDIGQRGGELNRRAVGRWLARNERRIEQGHELRRVGARDGVALWRLVGAG